MNLGFRSLTALGLTALGLTALGLLTLGCKRPSALPPVADVVVPAGCAEYRGAVTGNDKTQVRLVLCPTAAGFQGWIRYSSDVAGWSLREVAGETEQGDLVLKDVRFLENHPEKNWAFCLVDQYVMQRTGDFVDGRYTSAECEDRARITLIVSPR